MTTLNQRQVPSLLIIDDSPDDLGLMGQILATQGYKIELTSTRISELISRVGARPDLIIWNCQLSPMARIDLRSYLPKNKSWSNIPILLLSNNQDMCLNQAMEMGSVGLLLKPFELDRLFSSIDSLLKGKSNLTDVGQEQQIETTVESQKTVISLELDSEDPLRIEQQKLAEIQHHNSEQIFWQLLLEQGYQIAQCCQKNSVDN